MRRVSPFKIGLFVLAGFGFLLAGLFWVGVVHWFEKTKTYAAFFDQSVAGLHVGGDVRYLGLSVGHIDSIAIRHRLVRVVIELSPDTPVESMALRPAKSGITGPGYLSLVKAPPNVAELTPKIDFPEEFPILPSVPGEWASIMDNVDAISSKLSSLDLEGLVDAWTRVGASVQQEVSSDEIRRTLSNVEKASADLRATLDAISGPEARDKMRHSLDDLAAAAESARKATKTISARLDEMPPGTLGQAGEAVTSLRESVSQINRVLAELDELIRSLREEPGRIFNRPRPSEPFSGER